VPPVLHLFAVVLSTVMQALLGFALMFFSRFFNNLYLCSLSLVFLPYFKTCSYPFNDSNSASTTSRTVKVDESLLALHILFSCPDSWLFSNDLKHVACRRCSSCLVIDRIILKIGAFRGSLPLLEAWSLRTMIPSKIPLKYPWQPYKACVVVRNRWLALVAV